MVLLKAIFSKKNSFNLQNYSNQSNLDFEKFNHGLDITGKHIKENNSMINIAIGPEGGWSSNEKDKFKYLSNIGDFTLRTETASILGVSLLM